MSKAKKKRPLNFDQLTQKAKDVRAIMDKQVFRRKDGILQCPPAYAEGYGLNNSKK